MTAGKLFPSGQTNEGLGEFIYKKEFLMRRMFSLFAKKKNDLKI